MKIRSQLNRTKKATPEEVYKFWENYVEDLSYNEQQAIVYAHISPQDYENMDIEQWNRIMTARSRKDRPIDFADWAITQVTKGKRKEVK